MSTTKRDLIRRLRRLLVLGLVFCVVLVASYRGVHDDAVPLAGATAPAVLAVDTAQHALVQAQADAEQGAAGTGDFQTRTSVASLSLALAASENVTGTPGRQTLQTVAGLLSVYLSWVQRANAEQPGSPLRTAYLGYAKDTLGSTSTNAGIMGTLAGLQEQQMKVVDRQTGFGPLRWLLWAGWAAVLVSGLAVLWALWKTHSFLRGRFKHRWNRPLLAAGTLLLLGTAALARTTWLAARHLAAARTALTRPYTGHGTGGAGDDGADGIRTAGARVAGLLRGSGTHAALTSAVVAGAVLLLGLMVAAVLPRILEYPSRPSTRRLPAPRTFAVIGLCLAVLAGGVTVGVGAYRWHGSVTLLANWTKRDKELFTSTVIDPFQAKYHIHVIYQGSSAESQVLAADTEAGTAPDIVVLPGTGELAGFVAHNQLRPLEHLIPTRDFDTPWAQPVLGPDHRKHTYWVPVKADVKSLVWHPSALSAGQVQGTAAQPGEWCLGMGSGATSGWPGTDWVEDILLQQSGPTFYERWATGKEPWTHNPRIERAFTTWGAMVGAADGKLATTDLATDYGDAAKGVASATPRCRLEHAGAFVLGDKSWQRAHAGYVPSATVIPGATGGTDATGGSQADRAGSWEVSSDLAAILHDTSQSRRLIAYLASGPVQRSWSNAEHSFAANRQVQPTDYADPAARSIAEQLRDKAVTRCWDASDAMPPVLRDAFTNAVLQYLARPADLDEQLGILQRIQPTVPTGQWLTAVC